MYVYYSRLGARCSLLLLTKRLPALIRKPLNQIQRRCLLTLKMEPVSLKASTGITLPALKVVLVVRVLSPASTCIALPLSWGLCLARLKATVTKFCVARLRTNLISRPMMCGVKFPSFDRETQLLLYRIAESCKDSSLEETATMYLRTHASDSLLRSGFVDESIGDYLNCSFSVSKDDILQSLKKSGLDAPSSLFGKSSRWAKIHSHLQSLYETHPKEISETFVVLTGTPLTKEKAHVITRYLSPILWPTDQQTLFEL